MSVKQFIAATGIAILGMASAATAAPVTITVGGTLTSVSGGAGNTFATAGDVGSAFTGTIMFDDSVGGVLNAQGGLDYLGGVTVSMTFGGNTISYSSDATLGSQDPSFAGARIWDDATFGGNSRDRAFLKGQTSQGDQGINFDSREQDTAPATLGMLGGTSWGALITAVSSGTLLTGDFATMTISNAGLTEAGFCFEATCEVEGDVTSLTVASVPLPAGGALLIAGLGGFAAMRRFKK